MKIVHMTSVHPPFDTRIFFRECKTLSEAGFDVVLIAGHEKNETVDGIRIRAISKSKGRLRRIPRTLKDIYRAAVEENGDVYHFHDPELIPVGLLLKFKGKAVIYDVHEDYPASLLTGRYWLKPGLRFAVSRLIALIETIGSIGFTRIIAATPHIARRFPAHKTIIVQNFPRILELAYDATYGHQEREPIIAYVGVISSIRGVKEMVMAFDLLPKELGAKLFMAGVFSPPSLEEEISKINGWERVTFLGMQTREQVASLLGKSSAGLVLFHPVPNHIDSQPNKIFEYMCASLPVIASNFPLWSKIVENNGCGILIDVFDITAIAKAIEWVLRHPQEAEQMGKLGKEAISTKYNWEFEAEKLSALYTAIKKRA
jgi:glycosyltransferase involved in cell wall biosynthesis